MATTQSTVTRTGSKPITADELLEMHARGIRGELIRGVLSPTMPAGMRHGEIVAKLTYLLGATVIPNKLGTLTASDSGVRLSTNPDTVREPDIAYFSAERLPPDAIVDGYAEIPPDLVVEVVSPSDSASAVNDKATMWTAFGVRLVWVLWPDTGMIEVFRPGEPVITLNENDTLDGMDALPGFSCPVREVFRQ